MNAPRPFLSVVVPAHNAAAMLPRSLGALRSTDVARDAWELIVIDDASRDATSLVAAEYADVVITLPPGPHGPAYARNRGVEVARGEVVVFIDADVCVHADTLGRFAALFAQRPDIAAAFGSYDASPPASGIVSQFRNLLHHHVHQRDAGDAETFWAGCGAVRRDVLIGAGLMDAWHFPRPQIEDIELGRRLRRAGHRILLCPEIQCVHLKRWTLRGMLVTDFKDRGTPWMRLILAEGAGATPATLNLRFREKVCTVMAGIHFAALLAAPVLRSAWPLLVALVAAAVVVGVNHRFFSLLRRSRGIGFALAAVPLHLLFYFTGGLAGVAGMLHHVARRSRSRPADRVAAPASRTWPPAPDRPVSSIWLSSSRP
jgi:hypothetical protein